jgi:hypothetical protein
MPSRAAESRHPPRIDGVAVLQPNCSEPMSSMARQVRRVSVCCLSGFETATSSERIRSTASVRRTRHGLMPTAAYLSARDFSDGVPGERAADELDAAIASALALVRAALGPLGPPALAARGP